MVDMELQAKSKTRRNLPESMPGKETFQKGIVNNEKDEAVQEEAGQSEVIVSNIIGDFGLYQIAVVIFSALRAMCCAFDGLSGPFVQPAVRHFSCDCDISSTYPFGTATSFNQSSYLADPVSNLSSICSLYMNNTLYELDQSQCFFINKDSTISPHKIPCNKWSFGSLENENFIHTLTIEQSLVCDREWLKSLSNSMYYVGTTLGLLFWGIISDKYGRKTAYVCSHFVTLIFGFASLFAPSMTVFIVLRVFNAFGMIGELIPRSIQVEIVAKEYRFICSVICQIGWATGIILVPTLSYFNASYKFLLTFPVLISFLMLPWLIWLPESARWLIAKNKYQRARKELKRAAKINGKLTNQTDFLIEQFSHQVVREEVGTNGKRHKSGVWPSIVAIFTNVHLLKDTISVFVLLFVAEVVYFSLTLNVSDLSGSLYINYLISGFSELVSIAVCGFLLAYLSRRTCLSLLLLASTISYLLMALVNVYEEYLSMTVILSVNAFGKLTAIGNLMVIILVSQEVFPTVIRQTGTSLCITVGKTGSAIAPFTHELGQIIGQSYCFAMFSVICFGCSLVPLGLSETGNRELADTVSDVEDGSGSKSKSNNQKKLTKMQLAQYNSTTKFNKSTLDSCNGHEGSIKKLGGEDGEFEKSKQPLDSNNNDPDLCIAPNPENNKTKQQSTEDLNNNNNSSRV